MTALPAEVTKLKRWGGTIAYVMFVLTVVGVLHAYETQRDNERAAFSVRVCTSLDTFREATNARNEPLYQLVLAAQQPKVGDPNPKTGKPYTPAEVKEQAKVIEAFGEAYKPIPPVTNCEL